MKIKTNELTGDALDRAVAKREGIKLNEGNTLSNDCDVYAPSTDWSQGGPIIEREGIAIDCVRKNGAVDSWIAGLIYEDKEFGGVARAEEFGPTPLIAAMRCFVASKLGDEMEIPEELK